MKTLLTLLLAAVASTNLVAEQPIVRPFEGEAPTSANNRIDELVYAHGCGLCARP